MIVITGDHSRLRGRITESRDLTLLRSLHCQLSMSVAVEIATPESDVLVTQMA